MTPMTPTIVITEHFNNLSSQPTNNKRNNKPKINLEEILTQIESVTGKVVHIEGKFSENNYHGFRLPNLFLLCKKTSHNVLR